MIIAALIAIIAMSLALMIASVDVHAAAETSRDEYTVAKGVTGADMYVTVDSGVNVRVHVLRVKKSANVSWKASYKNYYGQGHTEDVRRGIVREWSSADWGFQAVRKQADAYMATEDADGEVIGAFSSDFFNEQTGKPRGNLVIEGSVIYKTPKKPFFAVLTDGDCAIRKAGGTLRDVEEAVGGDEILIKNGVEQDVDARIRHPRQAIGICEDGTVVIVNVDGREPASAGATRKDVADIMADQGCVTALNLDGGGSSSFLVKTRGDSLKRKNSMGDGTERNVGSALLLIGKGDYDSEDPNEKYTDVATPRGTVFTIDANGNYIYRIKGKRMTGFFSINGESYLFSKGIGVTMDVRIGDTIYAFKNGKLQVCSDAAAGDVHIGYCGASSDGGRNLLYAYQEGNHRLVIGVNPLYSGRQSGKMKKWTADDLTSLPWYSIRSEIETIYIGDGVTTIGNRFMYVSTRRLIGGRHALRSVLRSVRLTATLKKIGSYAFYNKPDLKNVTIPANVKKIGKRAFACGGTGYLRFRSRKVPEMGDEVLSETGYTRVYVKKTSAWKKFIKKKKFRKLGYMRTVIRR